MGNSCIHIDEKMLLHDLQQLISINSVNPDLDNDGPGEKEIANFLRSLVHEMG